jgi:hypothetical protein
MPIILAAQEAEIRRITVQNQPRKTVCETLSQKKSPTQKRAGGVAQGVAQSSSPSTKKNKKKKKKKYDQ